MQCPNCETLNRENARFCDQCGFPLTGAIAKAAAEVVARHDGDEPLTDGVDVDAEVEASGQQEPDESSAPVEEASEEVASISNTKEAPLLPEDQETGEDENAVPTESGVTAVIDGRVASLAGARGPDVTAAIDPDVTAAIDPDVTAAIGVGNIGIENHGNDYGERIMSGEYYESQGGWRDGNTMQMPRVESDEAPKSKDFIASTTPEKGRGAKTAIIVVLAIVIVAMAAAFGTYQMQLWGGKVVPDVKGMTEADATGVLMESGFTVRSTKVKSDDTEGLVLIMDPTEGSRAEEGSEIVIHIATGRTIPNIVGMTQTDAAAALESEGYDNVSFEMVRSDEPEGTVLAVSPEVETRAKSTVAVTVTVAEPYTVPDVVSLDVDSAIAAVQEAGLGYEISYVDTQSQPEGTVLGTEPVAGSKVKSNSVVVIQVARARGAQLVSLTKNMLSPGSTVNIDGVNFEVESLVSTEYLGNDTVAFTIVGRPFTYFIGQYVSLDSRQISGEVVWTPDNRVADIL